MSRRNRCRRFAASKADVRARGQQPDNHETDEHGALPLRYAREQGRPESLMETEDTIKKILRASNFQHLPKRTSRPSSSVRANAFSDS